MKGWKREWNCLEKEERIRLRLVVSSWSGCCGFFDIAVPKGETRKEATKHRVEGANKLPIGFWWSWMSVYDWYWTEYVGRVRRTASFDFGSAHTCWHPLPTRLALPAPSFLFEKILLYLYFLPAVSTNIPL